MTRLETEENLLGFVNKSPFCAEAVFLLNSRYQSKSLRTAWLEDVQSDIPVLNCRISRDSQNSEPGPSDEVRRKMPSSSKSYFLLLVCSIIMMISNSCSALWMSQRTGPETTDEAQMRNESNGTSIYVDAWLCFSLLQWPFWYEQLRGMSFQIRERAKQQYAFAYTVWLYRLS